MILNMKKVRKLARGTDLSVRDYIRKNFPMLEQMYGRNGISDKIQQQMERSYSNPKKRVA
jgi:hypothetical protein